MKHICIIFIYMISVLYSCSKKGVSETDEALNKPQFEFDSQKVYLPSALSNSKTEELCNNTPYWEGKSLKMEGYIFYFLSDTLGRQFRIYDTPDPTLSENTRMQVFYESSVDKKIKELFVTKASQKCTLKVSCTSGTINAGNCYKVIKLNLTKFEDIEFK
jgi:hypothetical protein